MNKLIVALLMITYPALGQYNVKTKINADAYQNLQELNSLNIAHSDLAYRVAISPLYSINQTSNIGQGYWRGLTFTDVSPNKFFESAYFYDSQGNLRETKSYFNIKKKGQLTNWSILIPTHRSSPAFVHTFR